MEAFIIFQIVIWKIAQQNEIRKYRKSVIFNWMWGVRRPTEIHQPILFNARSIFNASHTVHCAVRFVIYTWLFALAVALKTVNRFSLYIHAKAWSQPVTPFSLIPNSKKKNLCSKISLMSDLVRFCARTNSKSPPCPAHMQHTPKPKVYIITNFSTMTFFSLLILSVLFSISCIRL